MKNRGIAGTIIVYLVFLFLLVRSDQYQSTFEDKVRDYTRLYEFDYVSWTLDAFWVKIQQSAIDIPRYLTIAQQHQMVMDYIHTLDSWNQVNSDIQQIYTNPDIHDPAQAAAPLLAQQHNLQTQLNQLGPIAEAVIQQQVSSVLAEQGLSTLGQPLPPLLYHITPLPMALIVSPRNVIRQDANISLLPDLTLDQITSIENNVEKNLDVSALVVPVGGVGVYPTMVISSTDLTWLLSTVSHEWTHNYLTVRPLGINYDATPELRTMNETTADIVGGEISKIVIQRYYPELVPPPSNNQPTPSTPSNQPPAFDFNKEMHTTRVEVDALLAQGKIQEAESYMEQRRQFFWDNGYQIRRLNQAYFAFYGAYADTPEGAAGEDPVGPAVRSLRVQSATLADFVNRIAAMRSFQQLQQAIGQ
ncbi:MAG TPA: hypothetical protein VMC62_04340 [Longilinea sp.]|nr:hypothetical protein [Longilinea sp.]